MIPQFKNNSTNDTGLKTKIDVSTTTMYNGKDTNNSNNNNRNYTDNDEAIPFLRRDENEYNHKSTFAVIRSSSLNIESDNYNNNNNNNHHHHHYLLSDWEAGISLAKAIMGAGSFALPWAFSNMGYIAGPIGLIILMMLSMYSMRLLAYCNTNTNTNATTTATSLTNIQQTSISNASYVELARTIFGTTGANLSYAASMSASIGVCGSYLVFIGANLESLLSNNNHNDNNNNYTTTENDTSMTNSDYRYFFESMSQTTWILCFVAPLAIALSSVQNMKHFAFTSLLGNVAVILGMLVVVIYAIMYHSIQLHYLNGEDEVEEQDGEVNEVVGGGGGNEQHDTAVVVAFASLRTMPLSFGAIGYLFLVHFLVLPIQSNMKYPNHFCDIANRTFVICAFLSGSFGVLGYLYFGTDTEQIVLLNIQDGPFVVKLVQWLLCIDLLFTYPVVMRPSIVILVQQLQKAQQAQVWNHNNDNNNNSNEKTLKQQKQQQRRSILLGLLQKQSHTFQYNLACLILGLIAACGSIIIPAFGVLSGLVGGVSQTFLAFVLPPLMYLRLQNNNNNNKNVKYHDNKNGLFEKQSFNDKKPFGLVVLGGILMLWTLASTWVELTTTS